MWCVGEGEGGEAARPLRVEENLGLGIIQSCQGQVQAAVPDTRIWDGGEEEGAAGGKGEEEGPRVFMTSSCRLISG